MPKWVVLLIVSLLWGICALGHTFSISCELMAAKVAAASPDSTVTVVTENVLGKEVTYVKIQYENPDDTLIHARRLFEDPNSLYFGVDRVAHSYFVSPLGRYDANTFFRVYPFKHRKTVLSWGLVFRLRVIPSDVETMKFNVGSTIDCGGYTCADGAGRALTESTGIRIDTTWGRAFSSKGAIEAILENGFVRPDGSKIPVEIYLINCDSIQEILDRVPGSFRREIVDIWDLLSAKLTGEPYVRRNHFPELPQLKPLIPIAPRNKQKN